MRRKTILTVIVPLVLIVGALFVNASVRIGAQQGTPAAGAPTGVTVDVAGRGVSAVVPDRELLLRRRTFAPGASTTPNPADGPVVLAVESGTVGFTVVEGAAQLTRVGAAGTPGPTEAVVAGTEAILTAGDAVFYDEGVVHVVRNAGDGVAMTVEARLPRAEGTPTEATPGASAEGTPAAGAADEEEATPAAAAGEVVAVELDEFEVRMPSELAAGPTTFRVTNVGGTEHNFEVEGQGIEEEFEENLRPGETKEMTLDLQPGTYEVYCPVGNHEDMGMRLELTVTK